MRCELNKASMKDLRICADIIEEGKRIQQARGIKQWDSAYPDEAVVLADIDSGKGWLLSADGSDAGYFCLDFDGEPAYERINGAWAVDGQYATVHRLAVRREFAGAGLGGLMLEEAGKICLAKNVGSLRADTSPANAPMRKLLEKSGFLERGTVMVQGSPKIAYEKILGGVEK